jgi:hypothetical protein
MQRARTVRTSRRAGCNRRRRARVWSVTTRSVDAHAGELPEAGGLPSALLQHLPDPLGDLDEVVASACHATVDLSPRRNLTKVVDIDQSGHRGPVDVLEPSLALDGQVGRFGFAGVGVALECREGVG